MFLQIGGKSRDLSVCRREDNAVLKINAQAVRRAYTLAHALDCELLGQAPYERPAGAPDLPEKFALSGASVKIAVNGFMDIEFHRRKKRIPVTEVRIEEDAGRLTHSEGKAKMDYSYAGAPSIRIRTGASFELGEEAEIFLSELRRRIQYMGILKGVLPENVIRCNAYVSLASYPDEPGYYVKLRNLNSFNFVRKAINAELHRQENILSSGGKVVSESRIWNERQGQTEFYQPRESVSNLEVFPIAGAPAFKCPPALLAELRASAIEHPSERQNRLIETWGLSRNRAEFICDEKTRADFFEETITFGADAMETAHWLMADVTGILRKEGKSIQHSPLSPRRFAAILAMYNNRVINSTTARHLITAVIETDRDPGALLQENNWRQITDPEQLGILVRKTIQENEPEVKRLKDAEMGPLEFLTGLIMKKTRGLADPTVVKTLLKQELQISIVYVLAMGGTISGNVDNGEVSAGDTEVLKTMVSPELSRHIRFERVTSHSLLSEEIQPADWAALIYAIASKISSDTANGIVITHGTDTLAYTAALIYWLFADTPVPIIFTASNTPPETKGQNEMPDEARENLNRAIVLAQEKKREYMLFSGNGPCPRLI
ncbi:asparaginase domain-containing protein [Brucepastera parasyntrophica]|uniref:asparaginase domain-containing protein n=1 Tax=Brucepastera parasyntrophica TaxID=2880008 RepID=UPI002108D9F1|nr:asparaginase domain-containing protein [Brucepastera parasyntrophica]ULQ60906.1 asparaginase domain-containing protein [Brucepastera parasyntrophica]